MFTKNKLLAAISALLMMLAGSAMTVYAQNGSGMLDSVREDAVTGWGWDNSAPETPATVTVTITDRATNHTVKELSGTADTYREDLKTSGIGDGNHGFHLEMDWSDVPDGIYIVRGQVNGCPLSNEKTYAKGSEAQKQLESEKSGNLRSLGMFRTTGYCPCNGCSEGWGRRTSTGAIASSNHTIAVDPRVIPYGSKVMINGVVYTAEDRGGGVKGQHIDIFFDTHAQTRQHGTRMQEVFLIQ